MSKVLSKAVLKADTVLTNTFDDFITNPVIILGGKRSLLFVEWTPGDEDFIDIMPVFSGGEPDGQFYRSTRSPDSALGVVTYEVDIRRFLQSLFDEAAGLGTDADGYGQSHFFSTAFDVCGTHIKFAVRAGMLIGDQLPLSPGSVALKHGLQV